MQTISADGLTVFSEWAHLYYVTLGNLAYCAPGVTQCNSAQPGWGLTNTADFRNLQAWAYWSGLPYAPFPQDYAWFFLTYYGYQSGALQGDDWYALAVRPGDVTVAAAAVPEPMTLPLVLTALTGLLVARRRRALPGLPRA